MSGFLLIFALILWVVVACFLTKIVARVIPKVWWAYLFLIVLFLALLPLPLLDEILAKSQFEQLCSEYSVFNVDRAKAVGKTVYLAETPDVEIKGTWVRVVRQPRQFVDASTGEVVVSYSGLIAVGGRFIQMLGISEGGVPLTFKGWCKPGDQYSLDNIFKEMKITLIRRPTGKGA